MTDDPHALALDVVSQLTFIHDETPSACSPDARSKLLKIANKHGLFEITQIALTPNRLVTGGHLTQTGRRCVEVLKSGRWERIRRQLVERDENVTLARMVKAIEQKENEDTA